MYTFDVSFLRNSYFNMSHEDRSGIYASVMMFERIERSRSTDRAASRAMKLSEKNLDTIFFAEGNYNPYRPNKNGYYYAGVRYETLEEALSALGDNATPNRYSVSRIEICPDGSYGSPSFYRAEMAASMYEVMDKLKGWKGHRSYTYAIVLDTLTGQERFFYTYSTTEEISKEEFDSRREFIAERTREKNATIWPESPLLSMFKNNAWQVNDLSPAYSKVRELVSDLMVVREKGNLNEGQYDDMTSIIDALHGIIESRKQ